MAKNMESERMALVLIRGGRYNELLGSDPNTHIHVIPSAPGAPSAPSAPGVPELPWEDMSRSQVALSEGLELFLSDFDECGPDWLQQMAQQNMDLEMRLHQGIDLTEDEEAFNNFVRTVAQVYLEYRRKYT